MRWTLALALAMVVGCELPAGDDASDTAFTTPDPEPTDRGEPVGDPVTGTIGEQGGTLVTADGRFTLTIPEGALTEPTEIGIQPITNLAWGGIGDAYRVTPEDLTFDEPVELALAWDEDDVAGTAPEMLALYTQDEDGFWYPATDERRSAPRSGVVVTQRFGPIRDVSLSAQYRIVPGSARMDLGQSLQVYVENCAGETADSASHPCSYALSSLFGAWWVEGVPGGAGPYGTIVEDNLDGAHAGLYTAPSKMPEFTKIAVGVDFDSAGTPVTLSMVVNLADRWIGTSTWVSGEGTMKADFTFESVPEVEGQTETLYLPTGSAQLVKMTKKDCGLVPGKDVQELSAINPFGTGYLTVRPVAGTFNGGGMVTFTIQCKTGPSPYPVIWIGDPSSPETYKPIDADGHIRGSVPVDEGTLTWDLHR